MTAFVFFSCCIFFIICALLAFYFQNALCNNLPTPYYCGLPIVPYIENPKASHQIAYLLFGSVLQFLNHFFVRIVRFIMPRSTSFDINMSYLVFLALLIMHCSTSFSLLMWGSMTVSSWLGFYFSALVYEEERKKRAKKIGKRS